MATPRKLKLYFANFAYGGNGGIANEHPDIRTWFTKTILACKADNRIDDEIVTETLSDTPLTMTRNRAVRNARKAGCDVLIFCDSDQSPQFHQNDLGYQPFFESSFNFLYEHYDKGPVCIGAPYCGPPPHENVYVFRWDNDHYAGEETPFRLEQYTRYEAAKMYGISEVAALPTGLIMYDMRCFDITEPAKLSKAEVLEKLLSKELTKEQALRSLSEGWFYYEWEDGYASEKASTEDVTQTRDLSLAGYAKLGYNPVYCNWNSPIGHWKPWCVKGRPQMFGVEHIGSSFKRAVLDDRTMTAEMEWKSPINISHLPVNRVQHRLDEKQNGHSNGHVTPHQTPIEHLQGLTELAEHMHAVLGRKPRAVEIGSWHGDSAKALVKGGATVLCVDTWEGSETDQTSTLAKDSDPYMKFCQNTVYERETEVIETWVTTSESAARRMLSGARRVVVPGEAGGGFCGPFDIIFIDADHSYESVKADILAWLPHLSPTGVMVGHDYGVIQFPGVTQAVKEVFGERAKPYCKHPQGSFWMVWGKDIFYSDSISSKIFTCSTKQEPVYDPRAEWPLKECPNV